MSLERLPANTSWGRLQGDFRIVASASGTQSELHDPARDDRYVIVFADHPPPAGPAMITGQVSPQRATTGVVGTIVADDPVGAAGRRADLALPDARGPRDRHRGRASAGLPGGAPRPRDADIGRPGRGFDRERVPRRTDGLAPSEPIHGDWSGRIGGVQVARDRPLACTMTIDARPGPARSRGRRDRRAAVGRRRSAIRRTAPLRLVRLVRVGGSRPGLEIHAATADLLLSFDERRDRDRVPGGARVGPRGPA